jgi:hypothetical protein
MPSNEWPKQLNPDSVVAGDAMSEEQTFRNERSLSLRLIRPWRKWVFALRKLLVPIVPKVPMVSNVLNGLNVLNPLSCR